MLRMVDQINKTSLPQLPSRAEPRVTVDCSTCPRGAAGINGKSRISGCSHQELAATTAGTSTEAMLRPS